MHSASANLLSYYLYYIPLHSIQYKRRRFYCIVQLMSVYGSIQFIFNTITSLHIQLTDNGRLMGNWQSAVGLASRPFLLLEIRVG